MKPPPARRVGRNPGLNRYDDCTVDRAEIDDLIGLIYEAADNPSIWENVLYRLVDLTGSHRAHVFLGNMSSYKAIWIVHAGYTPDELELSYKGQPDPFILRRHLVPRDGVTTGSMLIPYEEYRQTEYYGTVGSAIGMDFMLAGVLNDDENILGVLALWRDKRGCEYNKSHMALMRMLTPHFRRAARLSLRLARAEVQSQMLAGTADALPFGLVLADGAGVPLFANRTARRVLAVELQTGPGRIALGRELQSTIKAAASDGTRRHSSSAIDRSDGGPPIIASILPLAPIEGRFSGIAPQAAIAVVFRDPAGGPILNEGLLAAVWGLTPTEANLALDLVSGATPLGHARRRGVSENTMRTHLSAVKRKVGVSSIPELVALLAAHDL